MKRCHRIALALSAVLAWLGVAPATGPAGPATGPNRLSDQEQKEGWKLLFDGKTLNGWRIYKHQGTKGWAVKDGAIYLEKPGSGDLMTEEKFADFVLSVDWKFEQGNNSGIIYRVGEQAAQPYITGPEMQVMTESPKANLGKNSGGALYDVYAPRVNALKPRDQWNTFKVVAHGKHLEQWVNGVKVVECEIGSDDWNQRIAKSKWKNDKLFASLPSGHIDLQDHGAKIFFRNVKIKILPAGAK